MLFLTFYLIHIFNQYIFILIKVFYIYNVIRCINLLYLKISDWYSITYYEL